MKTTCKMCGGNNFYVTTHNAMGFCFNCGHLEKEGQVKPAQRYHDIPAIRDLYTKLAHYYHNCLRSEDVDYLIARGITEKEIDFYKLGYVPHNRHILYQNELAYEAGIINKNYTPFLADRIVFPYWVRDVCTDMRGRTVADHPIKYLSPRGYGYYRGADYPYNYAALDGNPVVIAEGDIKAIISNRVFPTVSLPGIRSMRPKLIQRMDQQFIVCFDNQVDHMQDVIAAIYRLGAMFPLLRVATLPLLGKSKQDIDSFVLEQGLSSYERVINRSLPFDTWRILIKQ